METIENQSSLAYQYKVNPTADASSKTIESNTISTNLILGTLGMVKTVDKTYATVGDTLRYTVTLTNTGNILLSNIRFSDTLPAEATFITGSVKIDGTSQPTYDIAKGFDVGNMIILATKTITFEAKIASLPQPNTIRNKAKTTFSYLVGTSVNGSAESNAVVTTVNVSNVSLVKRASATDVEAGDTITYTIVITNNGNIDATNLVFTDVLDAKLTFVTGSVTVDGITKDSFNPNIGFSLADITPSASTTITFNATVNE